MLFTEPSFLFAFLPILLGAYFLAPASLRNAILTVASLGFYALGEPRFLPFLLASIAVNYGLAIWIEHVRERRSGRTVLALGIASDLLLLAVFKYAGWLVDNFNHVLGTLGLTPLAVPSILLPLGISFFTFHKISYKVDVYRGVSPAQRNPLTLALYILFFPQLIAGPIIRYHDIASQLDSRVVRIETFATGIRRIIIGLAKKIVIANTVAVVADGVFRIPSHELSTSVAWLGVLCYTLQIYFDFSGYSDMAIGLAQLFGFHFLENFDHPYSSRSITEFWRRWHISLSRWFRDYLYIPLGGNRSGSGRTYANLAIVFFLCGLWHGASWTFVAWGLFHGALLVSERLGVSRWLERLPQPIANIYVMLFVMVGWVFFRAGSFSAALGFLGAMFGFRGQGSLPYSPALYLDVWVAMMIVIGVIASFPVRRWVTERLERALPYSTGIQIASTAGLFAMFGLSLMLIAAGTYNPFLYFRF